MNNLRNEHEAIEKVFAVCMTANQTLLEVKNSNNFKRLSNSRKGRILKLPPVKRNFTGV